MSEKEITLEEKIEYIYSTIQKQESRYKRKTFYKWLFRILIIGYFIYAFLYILPPLLNNARKIIAPQLEKIQWLNLDLQKIGWIDLNNLDLKTIGIDDKNSESVAWQNEDIQKILEQFKLLQK